jgi:peptidoglycan DL-endopeptidase CwlO
MVSATADPKPTTKQLAAQVEKLYNDIETLSEQYNGEQVRLTSAKRSADLAKTTLAKSEAELATRRQKAGYLAQNAYMTGGIGSTAIALVGNVNPETYLDQASAQYALEQQQGQEVAEVANAMKAAAAAKASATAREAEVKQLLSSLSAQRSKITKMVKKAESNLYSKVASEVSGGVARRVDFPVIGSGKAAQAARWALSQQGKPYVGGAAGPSSFDCSGLIMAAYHTVGISLPHYTGNQWTSGTHISTKDLRPGDLVFFYSDLHHVGMYIGGGYMVHAPHTGDVVRVASLAGRPIAGAVRIAD